MNYKIIKIDGMEINFLELEDYEDYDFVDEICQERKLMEKNQR